MVPAVSGGSLCRKCCAWHFEVSVMAESYMPYPRPTTCFCGVWGWERSVVPSCSHLTEVSCSGGKGFKTARKTLGATSTASLCFSLPTNASSRWLSGCVRSQNSLFFPCKTLQRDYLWSKRSQSQAASAALAITIQKRPPGNWHICGYSSCVPVTGTINQSQ